MLDKSAVVALFCPLSLSLLTVTQACVMNATDVQLLHTHKAKPGLILLLFCPVTMRGSFYGGHNSDKCSSGETK